MGTVVALTVALGLAVLVLAHWQVRRRRPVPERLLLIGLETARSRHRIAALTRPTLRSLYSTGPYQPATEDGQRAGAGGAR